MPPLQGPAQIGLLNYQGLCYRYDRLAESQEGCENPHQPKQHGTNLVHAPQPDQRHQHQPEHRTDGAAQIADRVYHTNHTALLPNPSLIAYDSRHQ